MELHAEHLQLLLTLTDEAAPLWQTIGLELGFTYSEISWIASKPLRTPEGTLGYYQEMIAQWLLWGTLSHPLPTVEALTSALRKAGREQLALQIESEKGCGVVAIIYLFLVLAEGGSLSLYIQTLVTYGTLPPGINISGLRCNYDLPWNFFLHAYVCTNRHCDIVLFVYTLANKSNFYLATCQFHRWISSIKSQ